MKIAVEILMIAIGGACGAMLRHVVSISSSAYFKAGFPWGTLLVNAIGCLLMGFLIGSGQDQKNEVLRLGFGIGFLGSLTTFSTFTAETINLATEGNWSTAAGNVGANLLICLLAAMIGIFSAKQLIG